MRGRGFLYKLAVLVVFATLELALLYLVTRSADLQRIWVARAGHAFMGAVWGPTENVGSYFRLGKENRRLIQENERLHRELIVSREKLRQARIDKRGVVRRPGYALVPAEVVKMSRGTQHNYMILNRGFRDGVKEKSGVITHTGVAGIVEAVSENYAFALSLQNHDISISARLGTEGGSGILIWDGVRSNGALLKEIPLQYHYDAGDTVYTSGHSLIFPPDIPLGIAGEARVVNGATNEIKVTLFQDFSAIRHVMVVHNDALDEIEGFRK